MDKSLIKKIIIFIIIIIVIIIILLIILSMFNNQQEKSQQVTSQQVLNQQETNQQENKPQEKEEKSLYDNYYMVERDAKKLREPTAFFTIEDCIQNTINKTFKAKNMRFLDTKRITSYSVYGEIQEYNNKEVYYIVRVDLQNKSYKIEEVNNNQSINFEEINLKTDIKEIENNGNNTFKYKYVSKEDLCKEYLRYFTNLELNNPEKAYEILDNEYRKKRFSNVDEFKKYIDENRNQIESTVLSSYSQEYGAEKTEYKLKDSFNNYYTIEETSIMNFTVKLEI